MSRFSYLVLLLPFFLGGCIPRGCLDLPPLPPVAFVYSHVTEPLDTNLKQTPFGGRSGEGDIKHLEYQVSVTWDSNAIGDIAKEKGIETVYFADIEKVCLLGIWRQNTVHIYGE